MTASVTEARKRLSELIRAVQSGEEVLIARRGKVVAQLKSAPQLFEQRKVIFGGMKDIIRFYPGWDDPIDEDRFLAGDF
jgi:prevent-host-death family protein